MLASSPHCSSMVVSGYKFTTAASQTKMGRLPAVWNRSIEDPTSDVGVGLMVAYNCCSAGGGGGIKLGPCPYGSNAGNCHFDGWLHEDMTAGHSLLEIDATGNLWSDISLNEGGVADSSSPTYLLKVSGSTPTGSNLSNVVLSNCAGVTFDPASTPIKGLRISGGARWWWRGCEQITPVPTYNTYYSNEWPRHSRHHVGRHTQSATSRYWHGQKYKPRRLWLDRRNGNKNNWHQRSVRGDKRRSTGWFNNWSRCGDGMDSSRIYICR